jgi:hypothetical protein
MPPYNMTCYVYAQKNSSFLPLLARKWRNRGYIRSDFVQKQEKCDTGRCVELLAKRQRSEGSVRHSHKTQAAQPSIPQIQMTSARHFSNCLQVPRKMGHFNTGSTLAIEVLKTFHKSIQLLAGASLKFEFQKGQRQESQYIYPTSDAITLLCLVHGR